MAAESAPQQAELFPEADDRPWWAKYVRRKGHLGRWTLTALIAVGCVPVLLIFARILALPAGDSFAIFGLEPLRDLGETLNQSFSLEWVPPSDRNSILYLLLLPTGALLVAFARLTLGLRVLGLRAILIAIGFQASGLVPSLTLMAVVIGTVVVIRPWIRKIRLPLYSRIAVILSLSATIMVSALLIAPWFGSEAVWSVAFFPVIIMAMLAEGVAKTLEQDDIVMAIWRAAWTIVLALVIVVIDTGASRFTYQFPEVLLTQLVMLILLSEFFDLRLLEEWPSRISRYFAGVRPWYQAKPKIALVRNRDLTGVIGHLGRPAPKRYRKQKLQRYVDALREQGFQVKVFEGDTKLFSSLGKFLPEHPRTGAPGGIVLNFATGIQGEGRFAQVPAMLELAGVAYTGPDPSTHAQLGDRFALMTLLADAGIGVPRYRIVETAEDAAGINFPAAVRPRFEPDARRTVVRNERSLRSALREVRSEYGQPAVVEEIVGGREIRVSLIGNDSLEFLPLLEYRRGADGKTCPAILEESVAAHVQDCARQAFRTLRCRDYARIDIRLTQFGEPVVVDVNWHGLFARRGSFMISAEAAGYTFGTLLRRIVTEAARRYVAARRATEEPAATSSVVSLDEHRAAAG